jgi:hypothetical protein
MLVHTLVALVAFVGLHLLLAPFLRDRNTSARVHYILSIASVAVYAAAYPFGPEAFAAVYLPVMMGLYLYDLLVIAVDRARLRPSYVRFYLAHHAIAFAVVGTWMVVFETFTPSMAIGGLLFMSSDVWRWLQQLAHLSGRPSSEPQRMAVFWLERTHRLVCYAAGTWTIGAQTWQREEVIFCSCAVLMDVVDTAFQVRAMRSRQARRPALSRPPAGSPST